MSLWGKVREGVAKDENGNIRYAANPEWLRLYIDAGGPLVEGYEPHELVDAVRIVEVVKNGG